LLLRGYLMAPDFEKADSFHNIIGEPLFYTYVFLVSVVLQSFLTSVFSDSFSKISKDAKAQYLANFAYRVITAVDTRNALPPPFNLADILFMKLPSLCMSKESYKRLRYYFLAVIFCIPLLMVTFHEKVRLELDNARSDDSLSDDEGDMNQEQDFMTEEDEEVQGLQEFVGEDDLKLVVKLAQKTLKKSQDDEVTAVSPHEMLHADIKRVVRILDGMDRRLQHIEANTPPVPLTSSQLDL